MGPFGSFRPLRANWLAIIRPPPGARSNDLASNASILGLQTFRSFPTSGTAAATTTAHGPPLAADRRRVLMKGHERRLAFLRNNPGQRPALLLREGARPHLLRLVRRGP